MNLFTTFALCVLLICAVRVQALTFDMGGRNPYINTTVLDTKGFYTQVLDVEERKVKGRKLKKKYKAILDRHPDTSVVRFGLYVHDDFETNGMYVNVFCPDVLEHHLVADKAEETTDEIILSFEKFKADIQRMVEVNQGSLDEPPAESKTMEGDGYYPLELIGDMQRTAGFVSQRTDGSLFSSLWIYTDLKLVLVETVAKREYYDDLVNLVYKINADNEKSSVLDGATEEEDNSKSDSLDSPLKDDV